MPTKRMNGPDLQTQVERFRIRFRGPVQPAEWPDHLKSETFQTKRPPHRFDVFREIWGNRYQGSKEKNDLKDPRRGDNSERIRDLCSAAYRLRNDVNHIEITWRDRIEHLVLAPFKQGSVCKKCKKEYHRARYNAEPLNREDMIRLQRERASRPSCTYEQHRLENSSDFGHVLSKNIGHHPDDTLPAGIPMQPDGITGLALTTRLRQCVAHIPFRNLRHQLVDGIQMMYPFLLVEAKKESNVPGFRAIERQTAVPLRQLIKAQFLLQTACEMNGEPPLVWFFAYQGEEWRLYAGTVEKGQYNVYDLWHGNIESRDGALQLLQIVDYIWTWARDIYIPQIEAFLLGPNIRSLFPASTARRKDSPSAYARSASGSMPQASTAANADEVILSAGNNTGAIPNQEARGFQGGAGIQQEAVPTFLRWADRHEDSPRLSKFATVRHANISGLQDYSYNELSELLKLYQFAIESLEMIYANFDPIGQETVRSQPGPAKISFRHPFSIDHTANKPIGRLSGKEVVPVHPPQQRARFRWLLQSFKPLKDVRGSLSAWCALNNYTLIPRFPEYMADHDGEYYVHWDKPNAPDINLSATTIEACAELMEKRSLFPESSQLIRQDDRTGIAAVSSTDTTLDVSHVLPGLEYFPLEGVVGVKDQDWPETTPRFCLFVLADSALMDASMVPQILKRAFDEGNFNAQFDLNRLRAELNAWWNDMNSMASDWNMIHEV